MCVCILHFYYIITATFIALLGDNNKHEKALTKIFKKKIKKIRLQQDGENDEDDEEEVLATMTSLLTCYFDVTTNLLL